MNNNQALKESREFWQLWPSGIMWLHHSHAASRDFTMALVLSLHLNLSTQGQPMTPDTPWLWSATISRKGQQDSYLTESSLLFSKRDSLIK